MAQNAEANILVRIKETGKEALKDISEGLNEIKVKAAAAAALLTGFIALTVSSYANAEKASNSLTAALRNQGLDVDKLTDKYTKYAKSIQDTTTFEDDAVISGLAIAQSQMGNIEITEDLVKATVDLAAAKGMDLNSAFELVGKSIGTNTNALARHGVELAEDMTISEKMISVTNQLSNTWHGAAAAQAKGLGSLKQLKNEFGELLEIIGKQFAPFVEAASKSIKSLIKEIQNDAFAKWTAIVVTTGAAITGLIAVLGTAVSLLPILTAGVTALGVAFRVMQGPIGILLLAFANLVAAWKTNLFDIQQITYGTFSAIKSIFTNFISSSSELFSDFGKLLKSVFTYDMEGARAAFSSIKTGISNLAKESKKAYAETYTERTKLLKESLSDQKKAEDKHKDERKEKNKVATQEEIEEEQKQIDEWYDWNKSKKDKANKDRIDKERALLKAQEEAAKLTFDRIKNFTNTGLQGLTSDLLGTIANAYLPGVGAAVSSIFDLLSQSTDQFNETLNKLFGPEFIDNVLRNLVTLVEALPGILDKIIHYLSENMPAIVERLIASIIANLPKISSSLLKALIETMADPRFHADLASAITKGFIQGAKEAAGEITEAIKKGVNDGLSVIGGGFGGIEIGTGVSEFLSNPFGGFGFVGTEGNFSLEKLFPRLSLRKNEQDAIFKRLEEEKGTTEYEKYGQPYLDAIYEKLKFQFLGWGNPYGTPTFENKNAPTMPLPMYAGGGLIDNQVIRATAGEYVTNRDSTAANMGLLNAINNSNGRSVGMGNNITIVVNGGMLGDRQSAQEFARAVDEELYRLRQGNASRAFDRSVY